MIVTINKNTFIFFLYFIDKYKRREDIKAATKPAYDDNKINTIHQNKFAIKSILIVFKSSLCKKAIQTHIIAIKPII